MAMNINTGLTFDDVLIIPRKSDITSRKNVSTKSHLTRDIILNTPIISANMDTVTEAEMAIAMAKEGGIGIIHRFMPLEKEVEEVKSVKRHESFIVDDPFTLQVNGYTIKDAREMMRRNRVTGILVTDEKNRLVGILTLRDVALEKDDSKKITDCMTPKNRLVTVMRNTPLEKARDLLKQHKIEKLPIVDSDFKVCGLITSKDIVKSIENPNALKDDKGRLMVGAAIGVIGDYLDRCNELVKAGVDVIVVDIAHGHSSHMIETVKTLKKRYRVNVIAGNVATKDGVLDLIKAGADAIKVGIGPGSMCTTRIVTGCGYPQLSAIMECKETALKYKIPLIADGGIRYSGDITKAIAAGASAVMIGSLLAGTDESPGMTMLRNGRKFKIARGMASLGANMSKKNNEGLDIYGLKEYVAEGVEALVPYRGRVFEILNQLSGGLRSGMSYCGAENIKQLWKKAQFVKITNASLKESFPHDVEVL